MITSITASNFNEYKTLFDEAADILSGYKKIRTFEGVEDKNGNAIKYYKKNALPQNDNDVYIELDTISDLFTFAEELEKNGGALYLKVGPCEKEFSPAQGITSLEEYFSWLRTLVNKEGMSEEEKLSRRKYIMLPLDENHFTINANTRAITIPDNFKKYGIAVQGDHLAEVVYFKIDRYFDYMDLNNTEIFIQWEAPGKDENGKIIKGVSRAYVRDIESEPGKLIFGWAIQDVITQIAGNLKFSVRFFEWKNTEEAASGANTELDYSFSTLVATVAIQKSLGIDVSSLSADEIKIYDAGSIIANRIEDSEVVGGYQAQAPEFIVDMNDNIYTREVKITKEDGSIETYYECDLDPDTALRILHVHAFSPDTGTITYTWKKYDLNDKNTTAGEGATSTPFNEMIDITSERATSRIVLNEDETLYNTSENDFQSYHWNLYVKSSDGDNPIYTLYRGNLPPVSGTDILGADGKLYERQSSCTVDGPGLYYVVASNRVTNNSKSASSQKAYFLRPEDVVIETQPQATENILVGDNKDEYECQLSVVAKEQERNVKTYSWEYCDKDEHFDDPTKLSYNPVTENQLVAGESGTNASIKVKAPGYYRVKVRNDRNNDPKGKVLISSAARVTEQAPEPEFEMNATRFSVGSLDTTAPKVIIDSTVDSDKYEVIWFHYVESGENKEEIRQEIARETLVGLYEATFNPTNYAEAIGKISGGDIDGFYYAIVTNYWNDSTTSSPAPSIDKMFVIV